MLRPVRPNPTVSDAEATGRQLATFVRGNLNFSVDRVSDPVGAAVRSPISGCLAARPEVVRESGPGRSRLACRTGNSDRMRLIVEENGHCVIVSNTDAIRDGAHESMAPSPSRTATLGGRPRSSEGWERGEMDPQQWGRFTVGGPMSPVGGVRTARSSGGSLPRLGRPLVAGAVCTSPSLPADVPRRPGESSSPGVAGGGWWKGSCLEKHQRESDGSQSSCNMLSTPQRPTSKDEDGISIINRLNLNSSICYTLPYWSNPYHF